jgi:hypothetical protein
MSHLKVNKSSQILFGEAKENVKQQQSRFPDRNPKLALTKYVTNRVFHNILY